MLSPQVQDLEQKAKTLSPEDQQWLLQQLTKSFLSAQEKNESVLNLEKIVVLLQKNDLEKAQKVAESRQCTLEQLLTEMINLLASESVTNDPWMGYVVDQPELADQILLEMQENRQLISE
jgi:hypothetical protein